MKVLYNFTLVVFEMLFALHCLTLLNLFNIAEVKSCTELQH